MRRFFQIQSPCRDRAGEPDGGGGTAIDPGAPFEVGQEPVKPAARSAEKSDLDKYREETDRRFADLNRQLDESRNSERYWSERARGGRQQEDEPVDDREEDTLPIRREAGKPEEFLDDLSKDPDGALKKRGVVTEDDLEARLKKERERGEARLAQAQAHSTYDAKLAQEFPDLVEDNKRIARGEKPTSEIFRRTAEEFRSLVAEDPNLKKSPAAILAAARTAKRIMDAEKKATDAEARSKQASRRERIDNQRGETDEGANVNDTGDDLSPVTRQIMGNLSRHIGDNPEDKVRRFAKMDGPTRRNGRG